MFEIHCIVEKLILKNDVESLYILEYTCDIMKHSFNFEKISNCKISSATVKFYNTLDQYTVLTILKGKNIQLLIFSQKFL